MPLPPRYAIPVGTVTVTVTAKDKSGNTATCEFIVEVTDTSAPSFGKQKGKCGAGNPKTSVAVRPLRPASLPATTGIGLNCWYYI